MKIRRDTLFVKIALISLITGAVAGGTATIQEKVDAPVSSQPASADIGPKLDGSKIEGHLKCFDCHRAEYERWQASEHGGACFDTLVTAPEATLKNYAESVGLTLEEVPRSGACVACHGTPTIDLRRQPKVLLSVSCESCHNPSGGDSGWLNAHAVYGHNGTRREHESPEHYQQRKEACETAGQLRSSHLYQLVRRCAECHIPSNEALYNAGHAHKRLGFDTVPMLLGKVRHNYHLDQSENAEISTLWMDSHWHGAGRTAAGRKRLMWVLGSLIELEFALQLASQLQDVESDFAEDMADRITSTFELLQDDIVDGLDTEIAELNQIVEAVTPIYEKLDEDGIEEFSAEDLENCGQAARTLQPLIQQFAKEHEDGSSLEQLDEPDRPDDY